jgi:hypothetical protein
MSLLNRVDASPSICEILLAFAGELVPSTIEGYQPFYNSIPVATHFQEAYAGKASVDFSEESDITKAGIAWKQKLVIRFPVSDDSRAERLDLFHRVKYVMIKLNNSKHIILGRNDFHQNSRIKIQAKVNERIGQVEFATSTIFPVGYAPPSGGGLPTFFPINFTTED